MTFPSNSDFRPELKNGDRNPTPRHQRVSWWSFHTTASLLLNFNSLLASVRQLRREIAHDDLSQERIDQRARQVQAEVDDLTAIVSELRKRGHSVDWEE